MCGTGGGGESPVEVMVAGLASVAGVDVSSLADQVVRDELRVLLRAVNQLHAAVLARVASFDVRDLAESDGFRTARPWLSAFGRLSPRAASGLVKSARLLAQLPALDAAARRGELSAEHLLRVAELVDQVGIGVVQDVDHILAQAAAMLGPAELAKVCERVRAHADPDGPEPDPNKNFTRRKISVSGRDGMVNIRGQLDPEGGATLITALDAVMSPPTPDDPRDAGQRRADALVQLARGALVEGTLPTVGGIRPQIGILLTPDTLTGHPTRPGDPIPHWPTSNPNHHPDPDDGSDPDYGSDSGLWL